MRRDVWVCWVGNGSGDFFPSREAAELQAATLRKFGFSPSVEFVAGARVNAALVAKWERAGA